MANDSTWKNLVDGSFKGFRFHVAIPSEDAAHGATREELSLKARNQIIRRPGVNGAEVVRMGLDPEEYTCEVIFFGDNWSDLFDQFKAVLADPNPGKLVLPTHSKAVTAVFDHMTAIAQVGDGNAKTTTVSWIQDEASDQSSGVQTQGASLNPGTSQGALAAAAGGAVSVLSSAQSALQGAVNGANAVIAGSGVLAAVKAGESALSTVRRFSNTVLGLSQGIKNRITQIEANITSTMALAEKAVATISNDLGLGSQSSSAIASALVQATGATTTSAAQSTPSIDPDTGQVIIPDSQNPSVTPSADPLAPPALQPDTGLVIGDLSSDAAKQSLASQIIAVLQDQSSEMNGYLGGMASDIADSMTPVVNALKDFIAAAISSTNVKIVTTTELSLGEIMFYNGIGLDQLRMIHEQNPQVLDPAIVPSGTVVYL